MGKKEFGFFPQINDPGGFCNPQSEIVNEEEPIEKLILFRLIKNAQMQGARNPEE